jgi:hypothetical protein
VLRFVTKMLTTCKNAMPDDRSAHGDARFFGQLRDSEPDRQSRSNNWCLSANDFPRAGGFVLPQPRDTLLPHWAAFRSAVQVHSEGHHSGGNAPNVVMILSTVLHPEASNAGPLFMHCGWLCP